MHASKEFSSKFYLLFSCQVLMKLNIAELASSCMWDNVQNDPKLSQQNSL